MTTKTQQTASDEGARSFSVLLAGLGDGTFNAELSEELNALLKAMREHAHDTGKAKGGMTITLSFDVDQDGIVKIDPDLKTKQPKPLRSRGHYWLTPGNNLATENPKQQKLPLAEVPTPKARDAVRVDEKPSRHV